MPSGGLVSVPANLGFWAIIAALATARITLILHEERIARGIRGLFGIVEEDDDLTIYPETFWGYLFGCYWCLSVWAGAFCTLILLVRPEVLLPFALSMLAILLYEKVL